MQKISSSFTWKRSLLIWGIGDIYFILAVMTAVLFAVLSPDISTQLQLDAVQTGLLGSVFFLCYGVAQVFTGRLFDFAGPKITLGLSALIAICGLFVMSISQGFWLALLAKAIIGVGLSTSYIGAIYLADNWFPEERFALMSGITQMSSNILTALLIILLALSGILLSFRPLMLYLAGVLAVVTILIVVFVRASSAQELQTVKSGFYSDIAQLFRTRAYIFGLCYFSIGFGVLLSLSDLWNIPVQMAYHHTTKMAAILNAMFPLGGGIGALVAGWIADRLKRPASVAKFFISGMLVIMGIVFYGPIFSTTVMFLLLFILGFFFGGAVLGFPIVSQYIANSLKGTAFGLMAMCAYLLSALLQYLVGFILNDIQGPYTVANIHNYRTALTPLFLMLFAGWVISMKLKDR